MSDEEMRMEEPQEAWRKHGRAEKEEKEEKQEEKEEKGPGWGRDPLGGIIWALILIAAGLILLAQTQGLITWDQFGGIWNLIFVAVGLILLLEVAVRLLVPAYRRPVSGTLVFAFIMLAIGLGGSIGWSMIWPLFLIALGVAILLGGLFRGRF